MISAVFIAISQSFSDGLVFTARELARQQETTMQ
jgi:hypothetical protein